MIRARSSFRSADTTLAARVVPVLTLCPRAFVVLPGFLRRYRREETLRDARQRSQIAHTHLDFRCDRDCHFGRQLAHESLDSRDVIDGAGAILLEEIHDTVYAEPVFHR